ncbi:aspartate kinase [Fulvivirgaceae bacterium BMA10]|uniref:Aspartokinase n=1 Tax=Splendidivirga corallicola TaxID=3051826 RepID=A0ABT8KRM1_9BACT|nr:aspartate kinase [Fulvivirgaceae bacterium BMA10]
MQVFKFGGASIKNASAVRNMAELVRKHSNDRLLVVVSAMGKTTNSLEEVYSLSLKNRDFDQNILDLKHYHLSILDGLPLSANDDILNEVENIFDQIRKDLSHGSNIIDSRELYDKIVSKGEMLSSKIVHAYLRDTGLDCHWIDASNFISTDKTFKEAKINWEKTQEVIADRLPEKLGNGIVLTQGFIGGTDDGRYTTLGREGSDFTAAIFARCLKADSVTIWKDVSGVLNADPKVIPDAIKFDSLNYHEAAEMTYYGASVIHPKTIKPLANLNIPLLVKSFENPEESGTCINHMEMEKVVPSIIFKENQSLISFKVRDFTFINENNLSIIFHLLDQLNIKINMMQNSAISFSICIDNQEEKIKELLQSLRNDFEIYYNTNLKLITVKNYDQQTIDQVCNNQDILLEQKTRHNFQIVVASH